MTPASGERCRRPTCTPTPWCAFIYEGRWCVGRMPRRGATIVVADCGPAFSPQDPDLATQAKRNAELIAAAPEMHEALAAFAEHWSGYEQDKDWGYAAEDPKGCKIIRAARVALVKARGEKE